jgi:hypothetical protein
MWIRGERYPSTDDWTKLDDLARHLGPCAGLLRRDGLGVVAVAAWRALREADAFYDLVEQVSPGTYVELFARRARFR